MLGLFFWWFDRFERESFFIVVFAFMWGAFGAGLLSYFWNTFFHILLDVYQQNSAIANDMLITVMVAPFVEELTKGFIILILFKLKKIDNITDGILLGVLIGLGFAASENVHYAIEVVYPSSGALAMWYNLWFREIHTTLLHASATAVWGAMIGYGRFLHRFERYFVFFIGFILACVTHATWNFLATYVQSIKADFNIIEFIMRAELALIFLMLMVLFVVSLVRQSNIIIKELTEETHKNIIPEEHVGFFASLVRHKRRYQLPQAISAGKYAQLGVRLAFRKHAYRYYPQEKVKEEIEQLRQKISELNIPVQES
ncbi:PrsW family intramembrane metalloprotease [bacterium]|nr:PrsW family intramembrane metalloprotease [bacterium]